MHTYKLNSMKWRQGLNSANIFRSVVTSYHSINYCFRLLIRQRNTKGATRLNLSNEIRGEKNLIERNLNFAVKWIGRLFKKIFDCEFRPIVSGLEPSSYSPIHQLVTFRSTNCWSSEIFDYRLNDEHLTSHSGSAFSHHFILSFINFTLNFAMN